MVPWQYIPEDNSEIHNGFFITALSIFVNLKLDLWWANWQWGRVFFEYFGSLKPVINVTYSTRQEES
jgi:hypothetical protein